MPRRRKILPPSPLDFVYTQYSQESNDTMSLNSSNKKKSGSESDSSDRVCIFRTIPAPEKPKADKRKKTQDSNQKNTHTKVYGSTNREKTASVSVKEKVDSHSVAKKQKTESIGGYKSTGLSSEEKEDGSSSQINSASLLTLGFYERLSSLRDLPICPHCNCRGVLCHNKTFAQYCTKACMAYMNEVRSNQWDAREVEEETLTNVFTHAYRGKRRVEVEEQFGFYSSDSFDLPECMKTKSLPIALTLRFKGDMLKKLESHNAVGEKRYKEARNENRF